jgi:two-component system response regulator AlgR
MPMSEFTRVLIVDDEPLARERLAAMIDELPGYQVVAMAGEGISALEQYRLCQPDLILLDIAMPGMNGLEVARHVQKQDNPSAIIFCTAYGDYGLDAFETAAVGYLLKPVRKEQLENALQKASQPNRLQINQLEEAGVLRAQGKTHLSARSHRGIELLEIAQVSHFYSEDKYVFAHHDSGETILEQSLSALEEELGERFFRVHRNALVAVDRIEALERKGRAFCVRLTGTNEKPLVSRRHIKELKKLMERL